MSQRLLRWAQDLQDHHLSHGADPLFTSLMIDVAVLHGPMHEHTNDRISLAATYLLLNQPCIEMALSVWDSMPADEREALKADHPELHHYDDMSSAWSVDLLLRARRIVAETEAERLVSDRPATLGLVSPIKDDDINQLRRVVEYSKWRPANEEWTLLLHPVERYLLGDAGPVP